MTGVGVLLAWFGKGRFDALDRRVDRVETGIGGVESRVGGRIDGVEDRLLARMDVFQAFLDSMRSDLTTVALAVEAKPRAANP
jgi:hypothetical protein